MVELDRFEQELRAAVRGQVRFDPMTRGLYATDASFYQIEPLAVCLPRDEDDVRAAVMVARRHGVSLVPRGGGTALAGQSIGPSLILDFSGHLNGLLELNVEQRWARVQPGLVRDELNALLAPHGLHFAPDPATSNRAAIGGMIANNASGTRSIVYGKTVDHLLACRVLLADGTEMVCEELGPDEWRAREAAGGREGKILAGFRRIIESHRDEIAARYPKILRRSQGYLLDEFIASDRWNLAKLICGSEGTLATLLSATINLEPIPLTKGLVVAHFADLMEAIRAVEPILAHQPSAVEIFDGTLLGLARDSLATAPLCDWIEGAPEAVLAIELFAADEVELAERTRRLVDELRAGGRGYAWPVMLESREQARVWAVRRAGLGLMLAIRGDAKPSAFIEDAAVPVAVLPEYISKILAICAAHEVRVVLYAHASVGLLHVRPILNLKDRADIEKMKSIGDQAFELVVGYGGSFSGEHGDGLVRSGYLERFFGPRLYAAFGEIKRLFDPAGLMNPDKIIAPPPMDADLRFGPDYRVEPVAARFHYRREGGFAAAVENCNGVGACRKTLTGTMCPSYIATRDEEHSTRGRANALRLAMSGQLGPQALTGDRLHEVLDLCLSCKACKSECPSSVDLARLKSDALQLRHEVHGTPLRDRLIGASPELAARLAGPLAPLVNALARSRPARAMLERIAGFDRRRVMPPYARESFAHWFRRRERAVGEKQVVLFADTWLNYHETQVGIAATELLESCGYEVVLADAGCCQRPRISHGLLDQAKAKGYRTLQNLDEFLRAGLPVLVCEPSCASALNDDLPDLLDDEDLAGRARAGIQMIDIFLAAELTAGRLPGPFEAIAEKILIHGHCHQKSLYGTEAMKQVLAEVPNLVVDEIDSGCCGMAGSFGYEREHYELSLKVGEDRLFAAVRDAEESTALIASGFSCRHQLADATGRRAVHWVESVRHVSRIGPSPESI